MLSGLSDRPGRQSALPNPGLRKPGFHFVPALRQSRRSGSAWQRAAQPTWGIMRLTRRLVLVTLAALCCQRPSDLAVTVPALVITNISLLDGTGAQARPAVVRVVGDRIVAVV